MNTKHKAIKKNIINVFEQVFKENEGLIVVKEGIDDFLRKLEEKPDELALFNKAVSFFIYYANPILRIDKKQYHRITNIILIILFSLVEGLMQDIEFKDFARFLREKIKQSDDNEMVDKKELLFTLEEEYRDKYGSIEKVRKFFISGYVSENDRNFLLKKYRNGKYDKIEKVLSEIYTMRSKFIHNLGFEKLFPIDAILELVEDSSGKDGKESKNELEIQTTLNIKDFMIIVWVGILRKFGFDEKKLRAI